MRRLSFILAIAVASIVLVACSKQNNQKAFEQSVVESLKIQARTVFDREVLYRRWNSNMVGLFAVKQGVEPNPFMNPEQREATTTTGLPLVLVNPAYMTRIVSEMDADIIIKITSTMPINPNNEADDWEYAALKSMENGEMEEFSELQPVKARNGETQEHMRFIRQLVTEESCLKCHPDYEIGKIRGGISVSVPVNPTREAMKRAFGME
jgi:hypothetical protein